MFVACVVTVTAVLRCHHCFLRRDCRSYLTNALEMWPFLHTFLGRNMTHAVLALVKMRLSSSFLLIAPQATHVRTCVPEQCLQALGHLMNVLVLTQPRCPDQRPPKQEGQEWVRTHVNHGDGDDLTPTGWFFAAILCSEEWPPTASCIPAPTSCSRAN